MFIQKSINTSGRLGHDLVEWRERAGLTHAQAAAITKIHESLIRVWEEERWEEVGDVVYTERMLCAYVAFLGGNVPYMVQKFHAGIASEHFTRRTEDLLPRTRKLYRADFWVGYRLIAAGGFLLFAATLGAYVFFQAERISRSPTLLISEPANGTHLDVPSVLIRGTTDPEATVEINSRQAYVETNGEFSFTLDIPRGTTIVMVKARKRHGRESSEVRRVIYEQPLPQWNERAAINVTSTAK